MASRRYQLITRVKEEGQADFRPFKKQSWGNLDHAKREVDFWCTRLGNKYTVEFTIIDKVKNTKVAYTQLVPDIMKPWHWEYENKAYFRWWEF